MRHRSRSIALGIPIGVLLVILVGGLLGGCGGGGGRTATQPVVYSPNYIDTPDLKLLHWQTLPVKVFFAVPSDWSDHYSADLATTAAESWNQPDWQAFFAVVGSADQANVVCTVVSTPPAEWKDQNQVGVTEYCFDPRTNVMSSKPGDVTVTVTMHNHYDKLMSSSEMQGVIAHELGHVLGIGGHSLARQDLMYAVEQPNIIVPQARDLNTIRTAYQAYFGNRSAEPEYPANPSDLVHRTIN